MRLSELAGETEAKAKDTFAQICENGFNETLYEVQSGMGVGYAFAKLDNKKIEAMLNKPWAEDGSDFSARIWKDKAKLQYELENTLVRGIMLGKTPERIVKEMSENMQVDRRRVRRLVLTESAYFAARASQEAYKELGLGEYEVLATLDKRTSEICRSLDGKKFPMSDYKAGVTAPPFHVYCRSTTVPVVDDSFVQERAARAEDDGYYTVPADMTYPEWREVYLDKTKTLAKWQRGRNEAKIKATFAKIHTPEQQEDFENILSKMTDEEINLYTQMLPILKNNDYHNPRLGWYDYRIPKVEMNMDDLGWEYGLETGLRGAFRTKFHEEGHQLGHILNIQQRPWRMSRRVQFPYENYISFTDPATDIGWAMYTAIEKDCVELINKGLSRKITYIEELDQLSDTKIRRITDKFTDFFYSMGNKKVHQLGIVSDAIGLITKGRIRFGSVHDLKYCQDADGCGATDETWASMFSMFMRHSEEEMKVVEYYFPNTYREYRKAYEEVLEYVKKGGKISY